MDKVRETDLRGEPGGRGLELGLGLRADMEMG